MALGHSGLAWVDVRRAGHASLYARCSPIRGATAHGHEHDGPTRRPLRFNHSRWIPARMGPGWRLFWPHWGSARPRARVESHGADLRTVYRALVFRPNLVALVHLSLPCGAGYRRRMGRWRIIAVRDLASQVAALDRRRAPKRCQHRHTRRGLGNFRAGRRAAALRFSGRHPAGPARVLDSPRCSRDGRMAFGQSNGSAQ